MFDFWREELTQEETDALLDKVAHEIKKRKLELPASLMLDIHRPLSFVGSQAAIAFSPFLVPFFGFDGVNNYTRLLSKRENLELLLERLDKNEAESEGDSEG